MSVKSDPTELSNHVQDAEVTPDGKAAQQPFLVDDAIELFKRLKARPGAPFLIKIKNDFTSVVREFGAEPELRRLEQFGVRPDTLALGAMFFRFAPMVDMAARSFFGDDNDKKRKSKTLHKAIDVLNELQGLFGDVDLPSPEEHLQDAGIPLPVTIVAGLRFYAKLLFFRERLLKALDANSGKEIAKFTIAGAVHLITGKYHDREVSAMIGVLQNDPNYDETAHRVWRIRTHPRLNRTVSYLPTALHGLNLVLSEPREDRTPN